MAPYSFVQTRRVSHYFKPSALNCGNVLVVIATFAAFVVIMGASCVLKNPIPLHHVEKLLRSRRFFAALIMLYCFAANGEKAMRNAQHECLQNIQQTNVTQLCFRSAAISAITLAASACATQHSRVYEWTAQGYLSPGPNGNPEILGVFDNEADCVAAGDAWMSRQVVGHAIYADCLPVDHD